MSLHKKAEEIFERLGDEAALVQSYGNQALILQDWGRLDDAMSLHEKEEEIKKRLDDKLGLMICHWNTGKLLEKMGRDREAVERYDLAVTLMEELQYPDLEKHWETLRKLKDKLGM